jgi:hypothetical protein
MNWAMHRGQGIVLGGLRGLMAHRGIRGPVGSFLFMNMRLLNDQTLENATGVGALPWTWPVDEQVIDLLHNGIYALSLASLPTGLWKARRAFRRRTAVGQSGPGRRVRRRHTPRSSMKLEQADH